MESTPEKEFEDKLYSYLRQNNYYFTKGALVSRLKEIITDSELRKYGRRNIQKILNKMRDEGKVKLTRFKSKTHYSLNTPESITSLKFISTIGKPQTVEQIQKKKKSSGMKFVLMCCLITGIIGAVIGGFIGARIGQVALGILIGFAIGFFGPLFLAGGGGCECG